MTPIRITFDRSKCIAAKSCVSADPNTFGFDDTAQKAILRHGTPAGNDLFSRVIEGDDPMIRRAMDAAASCPVNAFKVENVSSGDVLVTDKLDTQGVKEVRATYDDARDFRLDEKGYFLLRTIPEKDELEVGFCTSKNRMVLKVVGQTPIAVYHALAQQDLGLRPEHYAYLGRELEKAYHCLRMGLAYVQDDELHTMRPLKK